MSVLQDKKINLAEHGECRLYLYVWKRHAQHDVLSLGILVWFSEIYYM